MRFAGGAVGVASSNAPTLLVMALTSYFFLYVTEEEIERNTNKYSAAC